MKVAFDEWEVPSAPKRVRPKTLSIKRLSRRTLELDARRYDASINRAFPRPRTYGECNTYDLGDGPVALGVVVPCPFASCKYNAKHEVSELTGSIKDTCPDVDLEDMPPTLTCVLRLADLGGLTLEELGARTGRTRERIRQIETVALAKMQRSAVLAAHTEESTSEPRSRVHLRVVDEAPTRREEAWSFAAVGARGT